MTYLDNRKMYMTSSLLYEKDVYTNYITEEDMKQNQSYSYNQNPNENNIYAYRYDSFLTGIRDADRLPKLKTDINIPKIDKMEIDSHKIKSERNMDEKNMDVDNGVCSVDEDGVKNICGKGKQLYNIMDPRFNLREAAKNMILLEDHLFHSGKQCHDCILKHCLTIEGFLEEGITLDKKRNYSDILNNSNKEFRKIFKNLSDKILNENLNDEDCHNFAQEVRKIRKPLCQNFATFF